MKHFLNVKRKISLIFSCLFSFLFCASLSSCSKRLDLMDYVSELRKNIFVAETEDFSLRIYSVVKESPYLADGIVQERSPRVEAHLITPEGRETCSISFFYNGKTYGGEMSFDNVKTEYYFSRTLDISNANELPCTIEYGNTKIEITAVSVKTSETFSPETILKKLEREEKELFTSLTDRYGFDGEIYLRLIYEDAPYYYVGIIDRNGKINAFLLNANTGKILAKRKT